MIGILEALVTGDVSIVPEKETRSPEHQKACEKSCNLVEKLQGRLKGEDKELFEKALKAIDEEQVFCLNDRIIRGFCLGVLVMNEVKEREKEFYAEMD